MKLGMIDSHTPFNGHSYIFTNGFNTGPMSFQPVRDALDVIPFDDGRPDKSDARFGILHDKMWVLPCAERGV